MQPWNIALAFYQNAQTAKNVLSNLRNAGIRRAAAISCSEDDKVTIYNPLPYILLFGFLSLIIIFFTFLYLTLHSSTRFVPPLALTGFLIALIGWNNKNQFFGIKKRTLNQFKSCVLRNEILILAEVPQYEIAATLEIMRLVETGHPLTFILQAEPADKNYQGPTECLTKPLSISNLQESAERIAHYTKQIGLLKKSNYPLLRQLKEDARSLKEVRRNLIQVECSDQPVTSSAEWLLDNTHVIEGTIEEVQRNLPKKYYDKLPVLLDGPRKDYPRVYAIAEDMIRATGNKLNREQIVAFLESYQKVQPLSIGELWAVPLMLRLGLVDCLNSLATQIDKDLKETELASFWGNRLLSAARNEPEAIEEFLEILKKEQPNPTAHFADELLSHLFDEEKVIPLIKKWLEQVFAMPLEEVIKQEQMEKTHEEVAFSSAIVSLINLSQLSWANIFESINPVDAILAKDPLDVYAIMSFNTKDQYRHTIESLSRHSNYSETRIAEMAINLAKDGKEEFEKHVGYYLVDEGRAILEKQIQYISPFLQKLRKFLKTRPTSIYLSALGILTFLALGTLFSLSYFAGASFAQSFIMTILALLPASEIALQLANCFFTLIVPPFHLPKMSYEIGIPEKYKTLVVVPVKVSTTKEIEEHINHLEVNFLANPDPMLLFGIFLDFSDAPQRQVQSDQPLYECAVNGFDQLEKKYGPGKFFLFYRQRVWSESERAWIGAERKRGKLEWLNRFLVGDALPENILCAGNREALENIRYVITLDADTQLPKEKAKQLVETISHPLNKPMLASDGTVKRGYTILQPRVSTNLSHLNKTFFTKIFADVTGANPYSQVVSDVYQDLMHEGNYHGKGIYDVFVFHQLLKDRFPDEHILSHDLLEGAYVRVGFASDIILYDSFPSNYYSWAKRQHRWIRGDWQIIDWLKSKVPNATIVKQNNTLSLISRWKIVDNLRRSLVPVGSLLTLLAGWIYSSNPDIWTGFIVFVLFLPSLSLVICNLWTYLKSFKFTFEDLGQSFLRVFINLALLPHQAYLSLDALIRVAYRRLVSHRNLLEWAVNVSSPKFIQRNFLLKLLAVPLFACIILTATSYLNPEGLKFALPFCSLWILSPVIAYLLNKGIEERLYQIPENEKAFLRQIARKTWRYFDDFVGPQSHWLPPDNYQAALSIEVANRTSPTNIGLWMVAVLSARDLKYLNLDQTLDRWQDTLITLEKLEQYEGHLLNWYDTKTLQPLYPRYVSTVDSGNFLASLWTVEQGLSQLISAPMLPHSLFDGIIDCYEILLQEPGHEEIKKELHPLKEILSEKSNNISLILSTIQKSLSLIQGVHPTAGQILYWTKQIENQLVEWETFIKRYYSWAEVLTGLSDEQLLEIDSEAITWRQKSLSSSQSLKDLSNGIFPLELQNFITFFTHHPDHKHKDWLKKLHEAMKTNQWLAGEKIEQASEIAAELKHVVENMNMGFLYNKERKLFTIGYHVDDCKLDSSYYDLLASEARIASLVSIAKGDVPIEHWWALGRPYGILYGIQVLLSWGGTMFEYLMPMLFNKNFPDSLLGQGCKAAVECQIMYGNKRGIPWGISESAYSDIDARKTYQYRSFGVPGLGFKRNLEEDLVVSPYSTGLALAINPKKAIQNFAQLKANDYEMLGTYGYFESIDFSRQQGPQGIRGVAVYAYMAHHQSMAFIAINNVLNEEIIPKRFHKNPYIMGVESLLYETPPINPLITKGYRNEIPISRLTPISTKPILGTTEGPDSVTPKVNLLSNNEYSVMITNSGGGYSRWKEFDLTRWRSDVTSDSWGSFVYIKDMDTENIWSTTFQPTLFEGLAYSTSFKPDIARIKRREFKLETLTEVVVSPEDNAEVRLITLANLSTKSRHIELTSYLELVLAPHATDRAHPAFNKMFIETEALPEMSALIAYRRLRSPEDPQIWVGLVFTCSHLTLNSFQYETDRCKFIGRGKTLKQPDSLYEELSNTTGTVLDPIFSLRTQIFMEPSQRVQVSFVLVAADNREKVVELIKKYRDMSSTHRALEMAWTHAQLELRHLRIHLEEAQLFQKLAGRILYPHAQLRPPTERLRRNVLNQSHLWAHGISGDLPIVVVSIADAHDIDFVKQALAAHAFWTLRGLKTDLIILCEEATSYSNPLFERLQILIRSQLYHSPIDQPGGIFLRSTDKIPEDELTLIFAVASVNLIAARGSLRQQIVSPLPAPTTPPMLHPDLNVQEELSRPLPFMELPYFNGIGGFTPDGKEYVLYLGPNTHTPAPWINVIANPSFGTMVSETGLGTTWFGNSQTNRLTPWSNDPVLNPISDILYIRDEQLGTYWTPTPGPIRELDAYRTRHGQGYSRFEHNSHGIEQDLIVFVPVDDQGGLPLRIQKLTLTNKSSHPRQLSITSYLEWVLGTNKEETQIHVMTEWDLESQSLFAFNRYHKDYGSHVAFASATPHANSFTSNRTEFLGRNHNTSNPAALKRKGLSGFAGTATDPCAALQVLIELAPDEKQEIIFVLGYAPSIDVARELIFKTRDQAWVEQTYQSTLSYWDQLLEKVHIETQELFLNFVLNRWLVYQNLSCRIWGRSAFYQSSGAFGFRDQLQDVMALLYIAPEIARDQILKAAAHQFIEGDVQHWWHPPSNGGVRTRITDDLLWLPFVTAQYVRVTKDTGILDEVIPFIKGELLKPDQHEAYFIPEISDEKGSLLEHCRRAIHKGITSGPHQLPLIGGGDWNDGMNRVGILGKGESVWLGWFLIHVLNDFADLLEIVNEGEGGESFRAQARRLAENIEANAWDGEWYRRAYFDDGTPLGSKEDLDDRIDSISQSWAVISQAGNPERSTRALEAVEKQLVWKKDKIVLLLYPPFDKTPLDPGYIKGYPPGVRENGAQYTHGSLWVPLAFAMKGEGNKAAELLLMMHPVTHTPTVEGINRYKVEPYVLAGDVYSLPSQLSRGGWSWYTGSCGWMYRIWIEEVLGFKIRGDKVHFTPAIPSEWKIYTIRYLYQNTLYIFSFENPNQLKVYDIQLEEDGKILPDKDLQLLNDQQPHLIRITFNNKNN